MFLTGESQEQRSLVGCRLWGRTESDTTEAAAADFQANKTNEEFIGRRSRDAKV